MLFESLPVFNKEMLERVDDGISLLFSSEVPPEAIYLDDLLVSLGYPKSPSEKDLSARSKWRQARSILIMILTGGYLPKFVYLVDSPWGDIAKKGSEPKNSQTYYPPKFLTSLANVLQKSCTSGKVLSRDALAQTLLLPSAKQALISSAISENLIPGFGMKSGFKGGIYKLEAS
jgi:hypothetical protein